MGRDEGEGTMRGKIEAEFVEGWGGGGQREKEGRKVERQRMKRSCRRRRDGMDGRAVETDHVGANRRS